MNKITTGIVTGSIIGATFLYAMTDKKTKEKIAKNGRKVIYKLEDMMYKMDML